MFVESIWIPFFALCLMVKTNQNTKYNSIYIYIDTYTHNTWYLSMSISIYISISIDIYCPSTWRHPRNAFHDVLRLLEMFLWQVVVMNVAWVRVPRCALWAVFCWFSPWRSTYLDRHVWVSKLMTFQNSMGWMSGDNWQETMGPLLFCGFPVGCPFNQFGEW